MTTPFVEAIAGLIRHKAKSDKNLAETLKSKAEGTCVCPSCVFQSFAYNEEDSKEGTSLPKLVLGAINKCIDNFKGKQDVFKRMWECIRYEMEEENFYSDMPEQTKQNFLKILKEHDVELVDNDRFVENLTVITKSCDRDGNFFLSSLEENGWLDEIESDEGDLEEETEEKAAAPAEPEAPDSKKAKWGIKLVAFDMPHDRAEVIRLVRTLTGKNEGDVIAQIDGPLPTVIASDIPERMAKDFGAAFKEAGAVVELRNKNNTDEKKIKKKGEGDEMSTAMVNTKKNGSDERATFKNTKVVREGEKIILPEAMSCRQAIDALRKQMEEDERVVGVDEEIDSFLFDSMFAFQKAMSMKFGWVNFVPTPGFFGDTPPTFITIETGVGTKAQVVWGRVEIPQIEGFLQTGIRVKKGKTLFTIGGEVRQKHRGLVKDLAELTRKLVRDESIYRGKAVRLSFPKEDERIDPTECPSFLDTSKIKTDQLIFSKTLDEKIKTALFNPVEKTALCRKLGISLKRGTLLAGIYGVGKSLAATVLSRKCEDHGWTYFYLQDAKDIAKALVLARQFQPAVVFVEDIDKAVKGDRDEEMDKIFNTLDGVDSKQDEIMVVFTTNNLASINKAMLRAKRLDHVIEVTPPDAEAVDRLIRQYTRDNLAKGENLTQVCELLAGQIPATIQEVCERAQLTAVGHMADNDTLQLHAADLVVAAQSMLEQIELTKLEPERTYTDDSEKAAEILVDGAKAVAQMLVGAPTKQAPQLEQNKNFASSGRPAPLPGASVA